MTTILDLTGEASIMSSIGVLGPVEVGSPDGPVPLGGPKQRAVLAMLVARLGRVVTTDEMVDGIWGESSPTGVQSSLHTYVSNLRSAIGQPIDRQGSGYRLQVERNEVDCYVFEDLVAAAHRLISTDPDTASRDLRHALALWRGRAYADVSKFPALSIEATRLEEARLQAVELRVDADLALGRHGSVVGELEALAAEYPLRESIRAKHMLALYRDGRQADALRAFQRTQDYLREELGVDASSELQELEARILNHDFALMTAQEVVNERLALLFTDVVQSTLLWETRPAEMQLALARHDDVLRGAIDRAGGGLVKSLGDGFIASFAGLGQAAQAAVTAQQRFRDSDWAPLDFTIRMALDVGEVERRGGDLFGPAMNRGSRLLSAAHGGQILLSMEAQRELGRDAGSKVKSLGEHRLKGLGTAQEIYQLMAEGLATDFPPPVTGGRAPELDRTFGDVLCGYELRERVGRGAFATVYRAYQPSIGREVAVKVIRSEFANHPAFVRRFEAEARWVASLEHPHIVSIYDYWRDSDGAYLVGPFMAGKSLADASFATLPLDEVARIASQIGSALAHAHRHGVVHRDIKPANILRDGDGNAYLADFGVAARAVEDATGVVSASAGYRAPEDRDGGTVDARSDIYSLGAVLARLLTGQEPPQFDLASLSEGVRAVLESALSSAPPDRPATVEEFMDQFSDTAGVSRAPKRLTNFRNPFKGLAPFAESDNADFFGRRSEIQRLVEMVNRNPLSAVVGPSGSGKSSLVLAGLLPSLAQLRDGVWVTTRTVPGRHPFDQLATALAALSSSSISEVLSDLVAEDRKGLLRVAKRISQELDSSLLLVVDQFEELFTLVASRQTVEQFVALLVNAVTDPGGRLRIVLTVRADFFHEALSLPGLGPIISVGQMALAPLGPEATREAIVEPAIQAGLELEPGLVERILTDVADQAGSLPLLQFTLERLAAATTDGLITHQNYEALGGVRGAIAERAEYAYRQLAEPQREIARHIFGRLFSVSEEADDVRRRVRVAELRSLGLPQTEVDEVLDTFGRERLLTFDVDPRTRGPSVAVAHEAVLREWPTLLRWIETRRESLILQRRFQAAVSEWEESGRDPANLLGGGKLSQYEEWSSDGDVVLTTSERGYLDLSLQRRNVEAAERRTRRRRIVAGFAAAAVVALVLAVAAFIQRGEAERNAALAEAGQISLYADRAIATDPELGILLALEAIEAFRAAGQEPSPLAIGALRQAVDDSLVAQRFPGGRFVAVSPDGAYLATLGEGESVAVWEMATGRIVEELTRPEASPVDAYFGSSGEELIVAYGGVPQALRIWEWRNGSHVDLGGDDPLPSGDQIFSLMSVDRQRGLVTIRLGFSGGFEVLDLNRRQRLYTIDSHQSPEVRIRWPSLTADGRLAFLDYSSSEEWVIRLIDALTGEELDEVMADWGEHTGFLPFSLSISPDGSRVAIDDQWQVAMIDVASGAVTWVNDRLTRTAPALWLPDGQSIFVGGEGAAHVLRVSDGEVTTQIRGGLQGGTYKPSVVPGSNQVAAPGVSVRESVVIDLGPRSSGVAALGSEIPGIVHAAFVGDGNRLAVGDLESSAVIDAQTGEVVFERVGGSPSWRGWGYPFFSGGGAYTAGADVEGRSVVWSNLDNRTAYTAPDGWGVHGISRDGSLAVIIGGEFSEATGRLVRTKDGSTVSNLEVTAWSLNAVFSPDDKMLLTDFNDTLRIWDTSTGALLREIESEVVAVRSFRQEFTPDGSQLVLGDMVGNVLILDVARLLDGHPVEEAVIHQIPAHTTFVTNIAISPDGSMILSRAHDEPRKLWDLQTGEKLGEFHTDGFRFGAFHPSEDRLYVSLPDDSFGIFALGTEELIQIARSRLTRDLTPEECETYLGRRCRRTE